MQEIIESVKRGVIDDRMDGLPALDFGDEEWDEVMADTYAELAKLPDRTRVLQAYQWPEQAALVEQAITAKTPEQIEAAKRAAESWLQVHPGDPAILSVGRYLQRREREIVAGQRPAGSTA